VLEARGFNEEDHPRESAGSSEGGQFTSSSGGIGLKREGDKWMTTERKDIPEHASKLGIPPAWTNVRVSPNPESDLQAIGRDAKGREQRIYSEAFVEKNAAEKFARNDRLLASKDKIVSQIEKDATSENKDVSEPAHVMRLIQHTGIRSGSEHETGAEKQAYGATTLEGRHVVETENGVSLKFVGKKGVDLNIPVEDRELQKELLVRKASVGNKGKIFNVSDSQLRDYSHTLGSGEFKPKDFRTLKGTSVAMEEVAKVPPPPPKTMKDYKKIVMGIAKKVAEKLGNTPSIALKSYIHPRVFVTLRPA